MASEKVTTGANRVTMGTSAYSLGAVGSPQRGKLVPKRGNAKGAVDPGAGTATHRGQTLYTPTLGAAYRVTAMRGPYSETYPATQANGRVVPSVTGSQRNFRSSYVAY